MSNAGWIRSQPSFLRRRSTLLSWLVALGIVALLAIAGMSTAAVVERSIHLASLQNSDPRRAGFAGLAQFEVQWFGAVLVRQSLDAARHAHLVAVPAGQADPTHQALQATGARFEHTDLQGHRWLSTKYAYGDGPEAWAVPIGDVAHDPALGLYNYVLVFDAQSWGATEYDLYVDTDLTR